jgi:hypothetical protein
MQAVRIKENNGGGEFDYNVRISVNVTIYPQYNNNMMTTKDFIKYQSLKSKYHHLFLS